MALWMLISTTPIALWVLYLNLDLNATRSDSRNMKVSKNYFKIRIGEKLHIIPWWRHTFISNTKSAESLSFVTRGTPMGNGRARCNYLAAIFDCPEKSDRFENDKKFHTVTVFFSFKRVAGWECGTCWTARYFPIDFDRRNFSSLSWFIWQVARPCLNSSQQVNTKFKKRLNLCFISKFNLWPLSMSSTFGVETDVTFNWHIVSSRSTFVIIV